MENGLSIIEKPQHTTLTYDKWLGDRAKQSQREEMRATIDGIMRQKPESFDALLSVLKEKGWEIHMPALNLCGDNAAMVGAQAYYEFLAGKIAGMDLNACAAMPIDNNF